MPCGVGWAYALVTTGGVGIYEQFNTPLIVVTEETMGPTPLVWSNLVTPPGFDFPPVFQKFLPVGSPQIRFTLAIISTDVTKTIVLDDSFTDPNLRFRLTTLPARNAINELIPDCPNPWTITPLSQEQFDEI